MEYIILIITAVLIKNILLAQYLGNCPFLGTSKRMDTAVGMGLAVIFVLTIATVVTYWVQYKVLNPLHLEYLQTIAFILVIAALVQFVEMFLRKFAPPLYQALGIFLPLITTNCAVLGVALLNTQKKHNFLESAVYGFGAAVGFSLVLILFSAMRERVAAADVPTPFRGSAIALVTAGLMSLAFMGFSGLIKG